MTIKEMRDEVMGLELKIQPLARRLEALRREIENSESIQFVEVNRIEKDDVLFRDDVKLPHFGTVWDLARWMRENGCEKRWVDWNGRIYYASDLLAGKMPETPAFSEHVK